MSSEVKLSGQLLVKKDSYNVFINLGALLIGVYIILGVGFLGTDAIHNAAHDVRHSFAFPCH